MEYTLKNNPAYNSIEIVDFGQNVEVVDVAAFAYCMSIKRIVLPKSVKYIGDYAFKGCASLEKITVKNPECEIFDNNYTIFTDNSVSSEMGGFAGTIQAFVPNEILEDYKNAMESIFGEDSCYVLIIRPVGGVEI